MHLLHVLNGDATRITLEQARIPGELAVWSDILHEGPVPSDDDLTAWMRIRAAFLASLDFATEEEIAERYQSAQAALETWPEHEEVVLWFEHDLYDQLLLIRHLNWWRRVDREPVRLSLICIGEYPGVTPFHGLGQLSPSQLGGLFPKRSTVNDGEFDLGRRAWSAFTASDPTELTRLMEGDTRALPWLHGALVRLLEEYPSMKNGLPRTEQQILAILAQAETAPTQLFVQNQRREERVFMGDSTFWTRVESLAAGDNPLVTISTNGTTERPASEVFRTAAGPASSVAITDLGREVVTGDADAVSLRGIDRWIGGVHQQDAATWRWDEASRTLIRT